MKVSDIPTKPILEFLSKLDGWAYWFEGESSVQNAMPKELPTNLVLAKMRNLIKSCYDDGCPCGCRGDYEITDKGREYIKSITTKEEV
jgi:hypothetical protein